MSSPGKATDRRRARGAGDARTFVCNSLAAKAQSVAEIEAKLAARGVAADAAAGAIEEARRLGYLDDGELAGQLARGLRARGYGRRRAAQTLRRRDCRRRRRGSGGRGGVRRRGGGRACRSCARAARGRRRQRAPASGLLPRAAWVLVRGGVASGAARAVAVRPAAPKGGTRRVTSFRRKEHRPCTPPRCRSRSATPWSTAGSSLPHCFRCATRSRGMSRSRPRSHAASRSPRRARRATCRSSS